MSILDEQANTTIHWYNKIQYNTIQQNDTMQYHTMIQYNTIQWYNTTQHNDTIQYKMIQYNTIKYNTIQYNTIQQYITHTCCSKLLRQVAPCQKTRVIIKRNIDSGRGQVVVKVGSWGMEGLSSHESERLGWLRLKISGFSQVMAWDGTR
jgi:hypothetical protein